MTEANDGTGNDMDHASSRVPYCAIGIKYELRVFRVRIIMRGFAALGYIFEMDGTLVLRALPLRLELKCRCWVAVAVAVDDAESGPWLEVGRGIE